MYGAECAECWVFQGELAFLKLKWTACAEYWMISVFDYYFGAECADMQNVGYFKENLPC